MKNKKTIGVLVGGISDPFTICLCRGIMGKAAQLDVNVIVFPCKYPQRDYAEFPEVKYEYQFETVCSLITEHNIDGIIAAIDCLGCFASSTFKKQFMERFSGIPCVLAASFLEDYPCVTFDNSTGIRNGIRYMIHELGLTRIGMIGGASSNAEAGLRKQAFLETLEENHIPFSPNRFIAGNMTRYDQKIYAAFLDANPDIQGIFCYNDEVAFGLYDEMKQRGLVPGQDISILGYDNSDWSSQIYPTLSTVDTSPQQIGIACVEILIQKLNGKPVSDLTLKTKFIPRNSFAKMSETENKKDVSKEDYHFMNYMLNEQIKKQNQYHFDTKQYIRNLLQFEHGNDYSYANLFHKLDWLQIKHASLFLYPQPLIHLQSETFVSPAELLLKSIKNGEDITIVPAPQQNTVLDRVFLPETLQLKDPFSLVVLPLYSNEMIYGYLLCDLTDGIFDNGEFLSSMMSVAVKMIDLLRTNDQIQQQLEDSLVVLRENNLALDTLSKSDPLTGIRNRRGFFDKTEILLAVTKEAQQPVLLLYVDMNNLKIINDRYGHEEGDFAIQSIAKVLTECMGENGIVGRIGGDEFACAVCTEETEAAMINRIYHAFDQFNETSDKAYMVTVSAGAHLYMPDESISLQDALALADDMLYRAKKERKKEVTKEAFDKS